MRRFITTLPLIILVLVVGCWNGIRILCPVENTHDSSVSIKVWHVVGKEDADPTPEVEIGGVVEAAQNFFAEQLGDRKFIVDCYPNGQVAVERLQLHKRSGDYADWDEIKKDVGGGTCPSHQNHKCLLHRSCISTGWRSVGVGRGVACIHKTLQRSMEMADTCSRIGACYGAITRLP